MRQFLPQVIVPEIRMCIELNHLEVRVNAMQRLYCGDGDEVFASEHQNALPILNCARTGRFEVVQAGLHISKGHQHVSGVKEGSLGELSVESGAVFLEQL